MDTQTLQVVAETYHARNIIRLATLNRLARDVLDAVSDCSDSLPAETPVTSPINNPRNRLIPTSYDYGIIDHDGPLEIVEIPDDGDPYNRNEST